MNTLNEEQLAFYKAHGYLHVSGAIPETVLEQARGVMARWVDRTVAKWQEKGLIQDLKPELDLWHRLRVLWEDAGRPRYSRSPRKDIVEPATHAILSCPALVDIAADLIGSEEITVHGVFNARPKLPDQHWTNTPWHQDAQYNGISPHQHVPTFWFPLQDVDEQLSCLGVLPDYNSGVLFAPYEDDTGFLGISPEDRKNFKGIPVPMKAGDLLCFTSLTPHHAYPNSTDRVRWSMDVRYQQTDTVDPDAANANLRFVARSPSGTYQPETFEQWYAKGWEQAGW